MLHRAARHVETAPCTQISNLKTKLKPELMSATFLLEFAEALVQRLELFNDVDLTTTATTTPTTNSR